MQWYSCMMLTQKLLLFFQYFCRGSRCVCVCESRFFSFAARFFFALPFQLHSPHTKCMELFKLFEMLFFFPGCGFFSAFFSSFLLHVRLSFDNFHPFFPCWVFFGRLDVVFSGKINLILDLFFSSFWLSKRLFELYHISTNSKMVPRSWCWNKRSITFEMKKEEKIITHRIFRSLNVDHTAGIYAVQLSRYFFKESRSNFVSEIIL